MNAELFRWARETAGLETVAAAKALGIKPAKLEAIEQGEHEPSRPQLLNMAKVYRRPLITFYLQKPPERGERGEDFRTLPPDRTQADDALLDALIRDVRSRQAVVRALAEEEDEAKPLHFIGSCTMKDSSNAVLASIKDVLRIDLAEYRRQKNAEEAFAYLRAQAENAGIYVLLMGNLGTHHSAIAVETFRGFAIADPFAPFVVINDQDARTAWSFTLLHEIAHLWLGTTGVSGTSFEKAIERFCNDVASSFLLPAAELRELRIGNDTAPARAIELITVFANKRFVSRKMVAYGLFKAERIDLATWRSFDAALFKLWQKEKATDKEKSRDSESGPNYYIVRRHRLGRALLGFVERSMGAGALTPVKAAKVLGVKPRSVYPLLAAKAAGRPGRDGLRG
jgi:Zn-dependent peptidase ImmA (M78 family)/transcriptional regulator with XRE-family HTH domain